MIAKKKCQLRDLKHGSFASRASALPIVLSMLELTYYRDRLEKRMKDVGEIIFRYSSVKTACSVVTLDEAIDTLML